MERQADGSGLELVTPPLDGTILPGITRDSILQLARSWREFQVSERPLTVRELSQVRLHPPIAFRHPGSGAVRVCFCTSLVGTGPPHSVAGAGLRAGQVARVLWGWHCMHSAAR